MPRKKDGGAAKPPTQPRKPRLRVVTHKPSKDDTYVIPWGSRARKNEVRCHHTHPAYPVTDEYVVYGGSCIHPVVKDCDVYVGLDHGLIPGRRSYPWREGDEFLFLITNFRAPSDPAEFKKLIEWIAKQLDIGAKVHVGCIGGHGRTGLVLAALHKEMTGDVKAIEHVRKHYCSRAVETPEQVAFLNEHFGIDIAKVSAKYSSSAPSSFSGGSSGWPSKWDQTEL